MFKECGPCVVLWLNQQRDPHFATKEGSKLCEQIPMRSGLRTTPRHIFHLVDIHKPHISFSSLQTCPSKILTLFLSWKLEGELEDHQGNQGIGRRTTCLGMTQLSSSDQRKQNIFIVSKCSRLLICDELFLEKRVLCVQSLLECIKT